MTFDRHRGKQGKQGNEDAPWRQAMIDEEILKNLFATKQTA
jgi:hypothetical protein